MRQALDSYEEEQQLAEDVCILMISKVHVLHIELRQCPPKPLHGSN